MKILIVSQFYLEGSGSGVYAENMAREFVEHGHDVLVLSASGKVSDKMSYSLKRIPMGCDENCLDFEVPYFTTHPKSNQTFKDLSEEQLRQYIDLLASSLDKELDSFQPDVVFCQHASIYASLLADRSVPYIIAVHGTDLMEFEEHERCQKYVIKGVSSAEKLVAVSSSIAERIKTILGSDLDVVTIPNGYDENLFFPRSVSLQDIVERYKITLPVDNIITFVGKFARFKGIDILLQAAAKYEKQLSNVVTLIAGDGVLRDELQQLAKDLKLKGVLFLGHRSAEEVAELFSGANVSVMPSRGEPFGLVALESLACATTVVTTNDAGILDVLNKDFLSVVPVNNPEALSGAIVREITSDCDNEKGFRASEYVKKYFTWSSSAKKLLLLLEDICEEKKNRFHLLSFIQSANVI